MEKNIYLHGLRGVATLGIFLFHARLLLKGTFPVTLFFMLSGFFLYLNKYQSIEQITLKDNMHYVLNKLKKWYPIHFVTFLVSIFVRFDSISQLSLRDNIINGIINLLLLQSFFQKRVLSYNNLSWYLSVTIFLYVISYLIIKMVKNKSDILCFFTIIVQIVLGMIPIIQNNLYFNPFYRISDLMLGMYAAKGYLKLKNKNMNYRLKMSEIAILLVFGVQYIFSLKIQHVGPQYYSILFFVMLIIIPFGKGIISKIIIFKPFRLLAGISYPFYMIHELVLVFMRKVFVIDVGSWWINNFIIAIPAFMISYSLAGKMVKKLGKGIKSMQYKRFKMLL